MTIDVTPACGRQVLKLSQPALLCSYPRIIRFSEIWFIFVIKYLLFSMENKSIIFWIDELKFAFISREVKFL